MWELTYRYEELYAAIQKNNWEMGLYHWDKLRDRMNTAGMKRPARTRNIEGMFLESGVWQSMRDALTSKSLKRMREEFMVVRQVCMACHVAEKVGFLNDSSAFERTKSFPPHWAGKADLSTLTNVPWRANEGGQTGPLRSCPPIGARPPKRLPETIRTPLL